MPPARSGTPLGTAHCAPTPAFGWRPHNLRRPLAAVALPPCLVSAGIVPCGLAPPVRVAAPALHTFPLEGLARRTDALCPSAAQTGRRFPQPPTAAHRFVAPRCASGGAAQFLPVQAYTPELGSEFTELGPMSATPLDHDSAKLGHTFDQTGLARYMAQIGQTWPRPNLGQSRLNLARSRPYFGRDRTNLARNLKRLAELDQLGSDVDQTWPGNDKLFPDVDQMRPELNRLWPEVGQAYPEIDQHRPIFAWTDAGPKSTKSGLSLANFEPWGGGTTITRERFLSNLVWCARACLWRHAWLSGLANRSPLQSQSICPSG